MNLSFLFQGRENTASYCSSPEVIPGKDLDIKKAADEAVTPYYTGDHRMKPVLVRNLRSDRAYFIDTCHTHERIIEVSPDLRVFFPKSDQQITVVKSHLIHLLERNIVVLQQAEPTMHEGIDYPAVYSEKGDNITGGRFKVGLPVDESVQCRFPWEMGRYSGRTDLPYKTYPNSGNEGHNAEKAIARLLRFKSGKIYSQERPCFQRGTQGYCTSCRMICGSQYRFNEIPFWELKKELNGVEVKALCEEASGISKIINGFISEYDETINRLILVNLNYNFSQGLDEIEKCISQFIGLEEYIENCKRKIAEEDHGVPSNELVKFEDIDKAFENVKEINISVLRKSVETLFNDLAGFIAQRKSLEKKHGGEASSGDIKPIVQTLVNSYMDRLGSESQAYSLISNIIENCNSLMTVASILFGYESREHANKSFPLKTASVIPTASDVESGLIRTFPLKVDIEDLSPVSKGCSELASWKADKLEPKAGQKQSLDPVESTSLNEESPPEHKRGKGIPLMSTLRGFADEIDSIKTLKGRVEDLLTAMMNLQQTIRMICEDCLDYEADRYKKYIPN
ncbi:hypothetical protein [Endozoicomonas ascidiicola]|uniref:hypothetical protein n=1 Tax=Endozoicomonas ascidiicola TaxID=1698521 RepID=UPI00082FB0A3|nr:hypothetical protein [Endozoicomonas ascidiicola]